MIHTNVIPEEGKPVPPGCEWSRAGLAEPKWFKERHSTFMSNDVYLHQQCKYIWRAPFVDATNPADAPESSHVRNDASHSLRISLPTVSQILTASQNPHGFHARYRITKADGTPCDPDAIYFLLRVDNGGSDEKHIAACRAALLKYATQVIATAPHLNQLGQELMDLLTELEKADRE